MTADLGIPGIESAVEIGRGGFAVVYRAEQPAYRRTVAVKVLAIGVLDDLAQARFVRECQAMGALSHHPNIVTLHEAGFTPGGQPYLVMAFAPGGSLEDRIVRDGPRPWVEMATVGVKMAAALEAAHTRGMIHRDVKPSNVLVSAFGEPQLADFGIARMNDSGQQTRSGVITASVAHAPPEILAGERASVRSDVYSLASTLFELVSGRPAFVRETDESILPVMSRVANEPVPDLRDRGVPASICFVIEGAMAKAPGDRPASAAELGRRLQDAQREAGMAPTELLLESEELPAGRPASEIAAPPAETRVVFVGTPPPMEPLGLDPSERNEPNVPVISNVPILPDILALPKEAAESGDGRRHRQGGGGWRKVHTRIATVVAVLAVAGIAVSLGAGGGDGDAADVVAGAEAVATGASDETSTDAAVAPPDDAPSAGPGVGADSTTTPVTTTTFEDTATSGDTSTTEATPSGVAPISDDIVVAVWAPNQQAGDAVRALLDDQGFVTQEVILVLEGPAELHVYRRGSESAPCQLAIDVLQNPAQPPLEVERLPLRPRPPSDPGDSDCVVVLPAQAPSG